MVSRADGPATTLFQPIDLRAIPSTDGSTASFGLPADMRDAFEHAPRGTSVCWGIAFDTADPVVISGETVAIQIDPVRARWLVIRHTANVAQSANLDGGPTSPMRGEGQLNEHVADYVIGYEDGSEQRVAIRRRHQIGSFSRRWGETCFEAVAAAKPRPVRPSHEQVNANWGQSQVRAEAADREPWTDWLWAWENPFPATAIVALRIEPITGTIVLSGISAGDVVAHPLRWEPRRKATLDLPANTPFEPALDDHGLMSQVQLDLGQVISAQPRPIYPGADWTRSSVNQLPRVSDGQVLVEYTSHPEASFHLGDGTRIPVSTVESGAPGHALQPVPSADRRVTLRIRDGNTGKPVAARLHIHGAHGEYLAPIDRHRLINTAWFEDYGPEFSHRGQHPYTYVDGETVIDLPRGPVFVEVTKGFEIQPVRTVLDVSEDTTELAIELDHVLPWRDRGWVTADTHVHFLSPGTALLEGAAEGINVVNLLATRWGELVTNTGDFDGQTTWGSREAGGDGEYLVRVGTENRQHVLGHISLLGYRGRIIAPMTVGGPDESALGDPVSVLLTEWARQCRAQDGIVVLPHFPDPRAEHAASIVLGDIDAVEMTSWMDFYSGIDPYSLSDWYRYLNTGYRVAAVGGTDKMSAETAVGTVRTYARLPSDVAFTFDAWMDAVRHGETFATYGPLLEFFADGRPMGSTIPFKAGGGTLDLTWEAASVTVPMTRVELVVNGEIRESTEVDPWQAAGSWSLRVDRSSWAALLVRGRYPDKPEMIAAHASPVYVDVEGTELIAAADAVTILEQIQGAIAYLDTVGTRADDRAYKRMRMVLSSAHRSLHNRLHHAGHYHDHRFLLDDASLS